MEFGGCNMDEVFRSGSKYLIITTDDWDGLNVIVRFFSAGIKSGEKCLYVTDKADMDSIFVKFGNVGINLSTCMSLGQFQVKSPVELFDNKRMNHNAGVFKVLAEEAVNEGYKGLKVIIGSDWFMDNSINLKDLREYESKLSSIFKNLPISIVSCYDIDKYGVESLLEIIQMSPDFICNYNGIEYIYTFGEDYDRENVVKGAHKLIKNLLQTRQELKRENSVYEFLCNLAAEVAHKDNAEEILAVILKRLMNACIADMGIITLLKNKSLKIESNTVVMQNIPHKYYDALIQDRGDIFNMISDVYSKGEHFIIDKDDDIVPEYVGKLLESFEVNSSIVVPIYLNDKVIGLLYLSSLKRNMSFKGQADFLIESCKKAASILSNQINLLSMHEQISQMEKMDALGILTSGVAHEFNNLLTPILGFSQIIKSKVHDSNLKFYLELIEKSARDGAMIVKRVQEFTRREGTKSRLKVDMNEIASSAVEMTQPRWKNEAEAMGRSIRIDKKLDSRGFVLANPTEMREVVTNILLNAADAIKKSGRISIRTWNEDDNICLSIKDNGIGMSEEVLQNIFTPFFTTKNERGTGLGMPIVYNIVRDHGGKIDVESKVGQGTNITVKLPVYSLEGQGADQVMSYIKLQGRVLVVDDQEAAGRTAVCMLEELGLTVDYVGSGREAIEMNNNNDYEIVLCDLAMPDMTGTEVARKVRENDSKAGFILMTGWAGWISKTDREYIDVIIDKPFTLQTISDAVKQCLI